MRRGNTWRIQAGSTSLVRQSGRVLAYIKALRRRGVSAVITLYAIRDLKGAARQEILDIHA